MGASDAEMAAMMQAAIDEFGTDVTINQRTDATLDLASGSLSPTYVSQNVTAHRTSSDQIAGSGGGTDLETNRYSIKAADLAWMPKPQDQLVDGAKTLRISTVNTQCNGAEVVLGCVDERKS